MAGLFFPLVRTSVTFRWKISVSASGFVSPSILVDGKFSQSGKNEQA
jgi:hypothetical protein